MIAGRSIRPADVRGSWPRQMFSLDVSALTSSSSCGMTEIPSRIASRGDAKRTVRPRTAISPSYSAISPESTWISVDFPAPFSPTTAWLGLTTRTSSRRPSDVSSLSASRYLRSDRAVSMANVVRNPDATRKLIENRTRAAEYQADDRSSKNHP